MTTEAQRAADYRASQIARFTARVALLGLLAGSVSARAGLHDAWAPVTDPPSEFDLPDVDHLPIHGVN